MVQHVVIASLAKKQIRTLPTRIKDKLFTWIDDVETKGLEQVRKIPGFHDEPLRGKRKGQRSIRLSRSYRAIYRITEEGDVDFVRIEEVNKHDY